MSKVNSSSLRKGQKFKKDGKTYTVQSGGVAKADDGSSMILTTIMSLDLVSDGSLDGNFGSHDSSSCSGSSSYDSGVDCGGDY